MIVSDPLPGFLEQSVPLLLILLRLLQEAMGRGRKDAVERRNREEGTMSPCVEKVMF